MDPQGPSRLVGHAISREEARQIADRFENQGMKTTIKEIKRGSMTLYEVWATSDEVGRFQK